MTKRVLILEDSEGFARILLEFCQAEGFEGRWLRQSDLGGTEVLREDYLQECGDDLSMASTLCHSVFSREAFASERYLDEDSSLQRRFYGMALAVEQVFREFKPDYVIVNNGFTPLAHIALSKAKKLGVPPLYVEAPIMPGAAMMLDGAAPYFMPDLNSFDADAMNREGFGEEERQLAQHFLDGWRKDRKTKLPVRVSQEEAARLKRFVRQGAGPIYVLAMQVVRDMSIVFSLPSRYRGDYVAWVKDVVSSLPEGSRLVIKRHPKCWYVPHFDRADVLVVDAVDVHELIGLSNVVVTLCSNFGLEAAMSGKSVVLGGRPFYGANGFTIDVGQEGATGLQQGLLEALGREVSEDALLRFVYHGLLRYQVWPGESFKLRHVMKNAQVGGSFQDGRRPFFEYLSDERRQFIQFMEDYQQLRRSAVPSSRATKLLLNRPEYLSLAPSFSLVVRIQVGFRMRFRKLRASLRKRGLLG